ncbi:hypothetical protein KIL84_000890 [Mauremys mutica]|uniref:Uncharacterized protein n=1 Tax=Mauremys mutica TaxID=74926 RepID=A0A9D4AVD0_9SAUR|nr:hypothetical protein KIL84_000890 [Mauremys mutica]
MLVLFVNRKSLTIREKLVLRNFLLWAGCMGSLTLQQKTHKFPCLVTLTVRAPRKLCGLFADGFVRNVRGSETSMHIPNVKMTPRVQHCSPMYVKLLLKAGVFLLPSELGPNWARV